MLMQGFVALMGVYTVCAFACCLWSWLKGPPLAPPAPPLMLAPSPPPPPPPPHTAPVNSCIHDEFQAADSILAEMCVCQEV